MFARDSISVKLKHLGEAAFVLPLFYILKLIPFGISSFMLGKLTRLIGRFLSTHQTAVKNLKLCFPEKSDAEIENIALNAWENLGRVAGEMPYITSCSLAKLQELAPISGMEYLDEVEAYAKKHNTGLMIISAHIGNWEVPSRMILELDPKTALIYRKANNPYVEKLIQSSRGNYTSFIIPKGDRQGMRDIIKHLKAGGRLGMLADQKMNDGIDIKFFGTTVKAPSSAGDFAVKYNMPIVTFRCIRDEKAKTSFVLKFGHPIYPEGKTSGQIMQELYDIYEQWIREYPNQWFWQHNRFNLS